MRIVGKVGLVLVSLLAPSAASLGQASGEAPRAWVRILPADSTLREVLVDSQRVPFDARGLVPVFPGRHEFTVVRRLNLWPPLHVWRVDTTVAAGDTLTLHLPTVVVIRSQPPDAQIWLGNRLLGRTPFWLVVEPRMWGRRLRFTKPGYRDASLVLDRRAGVYTVRLSPTEALGGVSTNPRRVKRLRVGTLTSASLTLLAGVAAVQLRNEANATYGKYLHAASLREMNRLYDRTRRLDRYSATAYGVFEVGFVVSFYLFLRWQAAVQD